MKKILSILVCCLVILPVSISSYSACTPKLILLRHAEDPSAHSTENLTIEGIHHAIAYIDLFKHNKIATLINQNDMCPIKAIYAMGTGKPEETAQIIAQGPSANPVCRDLKAIPGFPHSLPPGLNLPCKLWQEGQPLLTPDGSAILVLNRQTIQNNFLAKAVKDKASQDLIRFFGPSATFNGIWVFSGGLNLPFSNLSIWVQHYDYDGHTHVCNFRLSSVDKDPNFKYRLNDLNSLKISALEPVQAIPNWNRDWQGYQISKGLCSVDKGY